MVKEFNNLEEIKKYYDMKINAYVFKEDNKYIDLAVFNFDLNIKSNIYAQQLEARNINAYEINACEINAHNINAWDIKANDVNAWNIKSRDIDAWDISAWNIDACNINAGNINACDINAVDIEALDIKARDINYDIICCAYKNIICKNINGRRKSSRHLVLDGKLTIINEN